MIEWKKEVLNKPEQCQHMETSRELIWLVEDGREGRTSKDGKATKKQTEVQRRECWRKERSSYSFQDLQCCRIGFWWLGCWEGGSGSQGGSWLALAVPPSKIPLSVPSKTPSKNYASTAHKILIRSLDWWLLSAQLPRGRSLDKWWLSIARFPPGSSKGKFELWIKR